MKKIFLILTLLFITCDAWAADRYIRAAGGNYSAAGTWELTPGGAETVAVPTASDAVIGTALSGQLTITATAVAQTVDLSAYTNTLTHNAFNLTISGSCTFGTSMTYTPLATSTVTLNGTGTFTTAGKLMPLMVFTSGTVTTLGDNLSFMASKVINVSLTGNASLDMNGKTVSGDSVTNRVLIRSNTLGTARSITNFSTNFAYADFRDINPATGSHDLSGITGNSGDCGGNSANITFTTAATQDATVGGAKSWSDATIWTSRVPLPQDNVTTTAWTTGTLTADMPRIGKTVDFSGATAGRTLTLSGQSVTFYGSLDLTNISSLTGAFSWIAEGRGSFTMNMNGRTSGAGHVFQMVGGTMTLQSAITTTSGNAIQILNGSFTSAGFAMTATGSAFTASGTDTHTLDFQNSTISAGGSSTCLTISATGLTYDFTGSTFSITNSASTKSTNIGSGIMLYNLSAVVSSGTTSINTSVGGGISNELTITGTGAANLTISGSGTIGSSSFAIGGGAGAILLTGSPTFTNFPQITGGTKTVTITSGQTVTFVNGDNFGNGTNVITLNASTSTDATLTKSGGGTIGLDYVSITDLDATPASTWYYGNNSTFVSDTGWNAGNPPRINVSGASLSGLSLR